VKKILLLSVLGVLLLGLGIAQAGWEAQYPESVMTFPYYNKAAGFQTYILVSHMDIPTTWGTSIVNPNVHVRWNPKCGRGPALSASLTTKQTLVFTPATDATDEGWVEVFIKEDIEDGSSDGDWPLNGYAVILDIGNGVAYGYKSLQYYGEIDTDGSNAPVAYIEYPYWGEDIDNPIVANLWRHSDFGRTVIVLLDPNGLHRSSCSATTYLSNSAQLDLYSKSETDSHKTLTWCAGDDAGKPGIITVGVGTTSGLFGTTDTSINNPLNTMTNAPYGYAIAYNLRTVTDAPSGCYDPASNNTISNLQGVVFTRISNSDFPKTVDSHRMDYYWLYYD